MDYSLVQKYDGNQDSILRIEKRFTLHKVEIENQKRLLISVSKTIDVVNQQLLTSPLKGGLSTTISLVI
jgi:hypothetical protein